MFLEERYSKILDLLQLDGRVSVKDLATTFNVTEDCIRKYLKELEAQGKLKRVYGGAIPITPTAHSHISNVWERKSINLDSKLVIARKSLDLINDGDTIFLDASTTNLEIAKLLSQTQLSLCVITNMADILMVLAKHTSIRLISIGGLFSSVVGGTIGSEAIRQIQNYNIDKAFIGVCGINVYEQYLSTPDLDDGNTKHAIITQALETYLVMEEEKFNYIELYKFSSLDNIQGIITEVSPSPTILNALKQLSIDII
nr:DeoR/GlpR family DNA-binding transcription regulator [uncultured Niameybacter sp.]